MRPSGAARRRRPAAGGRRPPPRRRGGSRAPSPRGHPGQREDRGHEDHQGSAAAPSGARPGSVGGGG
eukprot:3638913-Alexandrium_andersonii.AAC.1